LRNVTLRRAFFHNGVFHRLEQVLEFYAERDTAPAKWYAKVDGHVAPFDDLPPELHKNVNREGPFGGKPGGAPALGKGEMRDILAFLATLTDADLTKK
jgi:cytochrome c peroxidase